MNVRQIAKILREEGFEMGKRRVEIDGGMPTSKQFILNLCVNNTGNTGNTEEALLSPHKKLTGDAGIIGISGILQAQKNQNVKGVGISKVDKVATIPIIPTIPNLVANNDNSTCEINKKKEKKRREMEVEKKKQEKDTLLTLHVIPQKRLLKSKSKPSKVSKPSKLSNDIKKIIFIK